MAGRQLVMLSLAALGVSGCLHGPAGQVLRRAESASSPAPVASADPLLSSYHARSIAAPTAATLSSSPGAPSSPELPAQSPLAKAPAAAVAAAPQVTPTGAREAEPPPPRPTAISPPPLQPVPAPNAPEATNSGQPAPLPNVPPRTVPAETDEAPLAAALRRVLARHPQPAEPLQFFEPATREELMTLLTLAARVGDGKLEQVSPQEASAWLRRLDRIGGVLRSRAPLSLDRLSFCRKIEGYGVYEPLPPDHAFQAGSDGVPGERVQVYVEVRNFLSRPGKNGHETSLASTLEVRDFQNRVVSRIDFPAVADASRTPRQDYFINYQFHVPANLPPGSYTLWVQVRDNLTANGIAARTASKSLDFRVRSLTGP